MGVVHDGTADADPFTFVHRADFHFAIGNHLMAYIFTLARLDVQAKTRSVDYGR